MKGLAPAGGSRSWEGVSEPGVPEGIGFIPLGQPSATRGERILNLVILRGPGMCHLSAPWSQVVCGRWYSPGYLGKGLCPFTFGGPTSEALVPLQLSPDPQSPGGSPHWPQSPRSQLQVSSPVVAHPFPGPAPRHPAAPIPAPSLFWEENSICLAPCSPLQASLWLPWSQGHPLSHESPNPGLGGSRRPGPSRPGRVLPFWTAAWLGTSFPGGCRAGKHGGDSAL